MSVFQTPIQDTDMSVLPTSNPGGNKPWRFAGATGWQIVVGAFTQPAGVTDHGALTGLGDDDHPQYVLANGSRSVSALKVATADVLSVAFPSGAGIELYQYGGQFYINAFDRSTMQYKPLTIAASSITFVGALSLGIVSLTDYTQIGTFRFVSSSSANSFYQLASGIDLEINTAGGQLKLGAANVMGMAFSGSKIAVSIPMKPATYTVATLPSASANPGYEAEVTDSSVTTFLGVVAGGGLNRVNVKSNGTNWLVN